MNELGAQTGPMLDAIKECSTLVRMTCWAGARNARLLTRSAFVQTHVSLNYCGLSPEGGVAVAQLVTARRLQRWGHAVWVAAPLSARCCRLSLRGNFLSDRGASFALASQRQRVLMHARAGTAKICEALIARGDQSSMRDLSLSKASAALARRARSSRRAPAPATERHPRRGRAMAAGAAGFQASALGRERR
jgi:hypothetical protein